MINNFRKSNIFNPIDYFFPVHKFLLLKFCKAKMKTSKGICPALAVIAVGALLAALGILLWWLLVDQYEITTNIRKYNITSNPYNVYVQIDTEVLRHLHRRFS